MKKVIHFESIDSTNTYLKKKYEHFDDFQIIFADHQTEGRGRLGNTWEDDGSSALFSILLKRKLEVSLCSKLPLVASVALHKVLNPKIKNLSIKWPNDLMIENKKLAGILTESIIIDGKVLAAVVGFGINLGKIDHSNALQQQATSLWNETQVSYSIPILIQEVAEMFDKELENLEQGSTDYMVYYKKHLSLLGQSITFIQEGITYEAVVKDITSEGNLLVQAPHKKMSLSSGEVHLIRTKI
jgi:BirA family transcriptional regulator, biotin operon repressor / biotin---[acetyl-CoA-carboxylase] ligase